MKECLIYYYKLKQKIQNNKEYFRKKTVLDDISYRDVHRTCGYGVRDGDGRTARAVRPYLSAIYDSYVGRSPRSEYFGCGTDAAAPRDFFFGETAA